MSQQLKRTKPLYQQLSAALASDILSGKLEPGARLPTTEELAARFGVTSRTAQQGAALLHRRGLIERIPGRGTFVSDRIRSQSIGVVFGRNVFGNPDLLFYQHLYGILNKELKKQGWRVELYFPAEDRDQEELLAELERDIAEDKLRGLIALCNSPHLSGWLLQHPGIPHRPVNSQQSTPDQGDTAYRGVRYLLDRGYRRIAVIMHADGKSGWTKRVQTQLARAYDDMGLSMTGTLHTGEAASHAAGRTQAQRILATPGPKPEAFLVLNDQGCMGVIFELLSRGLRIPDDVAVMALANRGIEIPCPVPLTRFDVSPAAFARNEIEWLMALFEDRDPEAAPPPHELVIGQSCGETSNEK